METQALIDATKRSASQASELSQILCLLKDKCGHDETGVGISSIADELVRLSTTLAHVHEAIEKDRYLYTRAFYDDLDEIEKDLGPIFEEITDCCAELQRNDPAPTAASVPWFFKKGRISRLQKHLHVLKTTLMVMKTVLQNGTEYGVQAPSEYGTTPRLMSEDRVILESVLANNRKAIIDFHNLESAAPHSREHSYTSDMMLRPDHNVASPSDHPLWDASASSPSPAKSLDEDAGLARRFTKRGVRLGVHNSILNLGAGDADASLRQKWLQQARAAEHNRRRSQLSNIPEDDPVVVEQIRTPVAGREGAMSSPVSPTESTSSSFLKDDTNKRRKERSRSSPIKKGFKRVMRKLSEMTMRDEKSEKNEQDDNSTEHTTGTRKRNEKIKDKIFTDPELPSMLAQGFVSTSTPVAFKHEALKSPSPSAEPSSFLLTLVGKISQYTHHSQQPFPSQGSPRILGPTISPSEAASLQRVQERGRPPGLSSSGSATSTPSKLAEPTIPRG